MKVRLEETFALTMKRGVLPAACRQRSQLCRRDAGSTFADGFVRVLSVPLLGGFRGGFMVAMHAKKRKRDLHESARPPKCSLPWESGAEDARTPNADAWSADSAASAKRLECVRFIGAFRPAREGQRFMAPIHDFGIVEAFHEPTHPGRSHQSPDGLLIEQTTILKSE